MKTLIILFLSSTTLADVDLIVRDMKKLESMYGNERVIKDKVKKRSSSIKKKKKLKFKFTDLETYFENF